MADKIKSGAKAAGVKSVFTVNGEVVMTSFGKGNSAVLEKKTEDAGRTVITIPSEPAYEAAPHDENVRQYSITGMNHITAVRDNPLFEALDADGTAGFENIAGMREHLEKEYFGKTFQDNIHIQLIHNILGIEKILAVHVNDIVYTLNRLLPSGGDAAYDFVGTFPAQNDYGEWRDPSSSDALKNLSPDDEIMENIARSKADMAAFRGDDENDPEKYNKRLEYFGDAFLKHSRQNGNTVSELRSESMLYDYFRILSSLRQVCMHGNGGEWLWSLETLSWEPKQTLDSLFTEFSAAFDRSFKENTAKNNYGILFRVFDARTDAEKKQLARRYYEFTVEKSYKYLGFSIKKLREKMLDLTDASALTAQYWDSDRGRLYAMFDFALYTYYLEHSENVGVLVGQLRASQDDAKKEEIYAEWAKEVWTDIKARVVSQSGNAFQSRVISIQDALEKIKKGKEKFPLSIKDTQLVRNAIETGTLSDGKTPLLISRRKTMYFTKLIYFLCLFLNGKEINDLLTTMINQFENIDSFCQIIGELEGTPCTFVPAYRVLENSGRIAAELRTVNSFARMQKRSVPETAKLKMYRDAANLLGFSVTDADEFSKMLNLDGKKLGQNNKPDHNFRNFIISNVIESSRFQYVIRYGNPADMRKLAENRMVVSFVLKRIPETQIDRYCRSCGLTAPHSMEKKIEWLTDRITGLNFTDFRDVDNQANKRKNPDKAKDKEQKQALISLYLTVIYLVIKNLIYVNSRYTLAFHCLDRDIGRMDGISNKARKNRIVPLQKKLERMHTEYEKNGVKDENGMFVPDETELSYKYSVRRHRSEMRRVADYLQNDLSHYDRNCAERFRNITVHMNTLQAAGRYIGDCKEIGSWFQLYHYLVQRSLADTDKNEKDEESNETSKNKKNKDLSETSKTYIKSVLDTGVYCKDFVKALCIPFGYNLPRYKNLTVDALFNSLEQAKKKKQDKNLSNETLFHQKQPVPEVYKLAENIPDVLYHVTAKENAEKIRTEGLQQRKNDDVPSPYRRMVCSEPKALIHLRAASEKQSTVTANRQKNGRETVVLAIDAKKMRDAGIPFYCEKDSSYLVRSVDVKYIKFPENT